MYEYLKSPIVTKTISSFKEGVKTCRAPQIYLTLVDNTADHLSGELTVRLLSIGNDDENAADGIKVNGSWRRVPMRILRIWWPQHHA